jgi:hypothetical protein
MVPHASFRMRALALVAFVALLLLPSPALAQRPMRPRPRSLVSVQVVDTMGRQMRTFRHHSQTFVLGDQGGRYNVVIRNLTNERLEVVMSVDGRDAVKGRRSNMSRDRGYLLSPRGSTTIEGFRTSLDSVAAFRFTNPGDSFAGRMGQRMSMGTIRVSVFRERQRAIIMSPRSRHMKKRRARAGSPRSGSKGSADRAAPGMKRRRANNLGTQFGESMDSRVRQVSFQRDGRGVAQTVALRYDDVEGLESRGIRVRMRRHHRRMRPRQRPIERQPQFSQPPPGDMRR